jgi:hypothetical protein
VTEPAADNAVPFEGPPAVIAAASPADEFELASGLEPAPWKMLIYGQPGVGKSTIATKAPAPIFLDLESGLKYIKCTKNRRKLQSFDDIIKWLTWVSSKNEFKTVVIDTIDELEKMLSAVVVADYNQGSRVKVKTVADIPYGRGGDLVANEWKRFIRIADRLNELGKNVLLTGHEQVVRFENPSDANYDFFTINIHKKAAPVVTAKLDAVLYARFQTYVKDPSDGKGKAVGTGERILCTAPAASWTAKNRFDLPETMPLIRDTDLFDRISQGRSDA